MPLLTKAVKGTADVLPGESYKWQYLERVLLDICRFFGFREIRFPVFEHTELFFRSVGETTDVVQKEMYTFEDKGGRSITLRPEGTAGAIRAILEHGLLNTALPLKVCYFVSCYRYEKPQSGRYREFHQFGVEMVGSPMPRADVEVISLARKSLDMLSLKSVELEINSIGCKKCRAEYHKALYEYFSGKDDLCGTCKGRLNRNPMRILDCKSPVCSEIAAGAPAILDYLCEDCAAHFHEVKKGLDDLKIEYKVNPRIVRGLDYYNRTVFEFVSKDAGAQGTVCGGGRYDGLIEELGGAPTPSLGFAMGLERVLMVMEKQGVCFPEPEGCDVYVASIGDRAARKALEIADKLREEGFFAECDTMGRSLKAQMKHADKIGARFTVVLGDEEIDKGRVVIKGMRDKSEMETELCDIADALYRLRADRDLDEIAKGIDIDSMGLDIRGIMEKRT